MIHFQTLEQMAFFVREEFFYVLKEFHCLVEIFIPVTKERMVTSAGHHTFPMSDFYAELKTI